MNEKSFTPDTAARLANRLRGQTLVVPNLLKEHMASWPQGLINEHYERLQHVFNGILDCHVHDLKYRQKLKESDFAMFTSIWWPTAKWENLYIGGLLTIWAFIWDDTIDMAEQSLSADFGRACAHRRQTIEYIRYHLDVEDGDDLDPQSLWQPRRVVGRLVNSVIDWFGFRALPPPCPAGGCDIFRELGERLCARWDKGKRQRIFRELRDYIMSTEQEQRERLEGIMPTYESYVKQRLYTTAFRNFAIVGSLCVETDIPADIFNSPEMEVVLQEGNWIIIIVNDLLSLKKEMATHCMGSLVPVLYNFHHHRLSQQQKEDPNLLDKIVSKLSAELAASVKRLDRAEESLLRIVDSGSCRRTPGEVAKLREDIKTYVDMIRRTDTGTWEYSCAVDRYRIQQCVQEDGSVLIPL
ncbi:hypothetical protein PgNI_06421 [Pyricularia grisea]|uniref:Terpene synthase n=1 Tax=Pyricularia grisea TaxID=148305 RepID=A0A6P8B8E9_PYRGI|nr:hypothetical protein PgNI_06421 [Pyricularia grisea]TLD11394.1 hypothetical protein PgNI_06421 [Pyricularia grisea]